MRTTLTVSILAVLLALTTLAPAQASTTETTEAEGVEITLRSAPAGFVAPSAPFVGNEATWLVDPVEEENVRELDGVAGCQLHVTDRNGDGIVDGADALDEATAAGCIDGWSGRNHDTCADGDVLVAEIDGLEEVYPATFWIIHRNGQTASVGICGMVLEDGESLGFVYE